MKKTANILYRAISGVNLLLDVYQPDAPGSYPTVLVLPGGAWTACNKDDWTLQFQVARLPAAGYVAVVPQYRLCPPNGPFLAPAPVDDIRACIDWVRANGAAYFVNPLRVGLLGFSAGGHIALLLATEADRALRCVASWSGPTHFPACSATFWAGLIQNYIGVPYYQNPSRWRDASAQQFVGPGAPPTFLAHAQQDGIVPYQQAVDYADYLAKLGVVVETSFVSGGNHANMLDATAWAPTMDFLGRYL